jgi:hypothetical protein
MQIKILKKKPTIEIDGEEYIDLSNNSFLSDEIFDQILGFDVVTEDHEMRPDLIALKWYGSSVNIDLLLKVNNIFNPYSIKEGDILIIPALKEEKKVYKNPGEVKKFELRKNFTDITRMSENDIKRLKDIVAKNKDKKTRLKNPIPPNMLEDGTTNKKFTEDGQIILTDHHNK